MNKSKPLALDGDALVDFTNTVNARVKKLNESENQIDEPDIPPHLMDEILQLVDRPRTTLNTHRMNKLLKKAGLSSQYGKHKGKL